MRLLSSSACVAIGVVAFAAACDDSRRCDTAADCFSGESCIGGTCLGDESGGQDNNGEADAGDDATGDTEGPGEVESCLKDRIDEPTCTDPYEGDGSNDNNDSSTQGYQFEFGRAGCVTSDEFTPAEETLSATLCFDEYEDWYKFQLFECDDTQFRVRVDVVPARNCETPLELRGWDCESADVRCETLEDGTLRMTRIYRRTSTEQLLVSSFGVVSTVDDQQVDYTLTVKVYR
ncbi:MAG: hypothetical protein ACQEVA_00565 [Myxococcota bacterium]